jgi:integrase
MVSDIRNMLRSALATAVSEDLLARNVAAAVKLAPVRRRKGKAWSSDEARRFLESARDDEDPLYAAYVLVLVLGLRRGEVLGLVWDDIDLDAAQLTVGRQLQRIRRRLLHRETKTEASDSSMPLPEICVAALRYRRDRQESIRRQVGYEGAAKEFVFTTRFGTPVEPRNFFRAYMKRIRTAGVRRITVHDARRTCASLLADLDVHPRVAMQILRHADFKVTMEVYTQVSSKQTRDALRRLGDVLRTG